MSEFEDEHTVTINGQDMPLNDALLAFEPQNLQKRRVLPVTREKSSTPDKAALEAFYRSKNLDALKIMALLKFPDTSLAYVNGEFALSTPAGVTKMSDIARLSPKKVISAQDQSGPEL
jgi:hypothetical protein